MSAFHGLRSNFPNIHIHIHIFRRTRGCVCVCVRACVRACACIYRFTYMWCTHVQSSNEADNIRRDHGGPKDILITRKKVVCVVELREFTRHGGSGGGEEGEAGRRGQGGSGALSIRVRVWSNCPAACVYTHMHTYKTHTREVPPPKPQPQPPPPPHTYTHTHTHTHNHLRRMMEAGIARVSLAQQFVDRV
jgi:hypothetical protein